MSNSNHVTTEKTIDFRGGGFAPKSKKWLGFVVFFFILAFIEIGTRVGFISNLTLPRPSDVFTTFLELWESGLLWEHLIPSLTRLFVGASIGSSLGICVGIL